MAQNSHNLSVIFDTDSPICCLGGRSFVTTQVGVRISLFQYVHFKKIYYPQCACSNILESKTISIGMAEDVCKGLTVSFIHCKLILLFFGSCLLPNLEMSYIVPETFQEYVAHIWLIPCRHLLRVGLLISINSVTTHLYVFPFSKSCQIFRSFYPCGVRSFTFLF